MMEIWAALVLLVIFIGYLALRNVSPCVGCCVAADGGQIDCEKDCVAFLEYKKRRIGRP